MNTTETIPTVLVTGHDTGNDILTVMFPYAHTVEAYVDKQRLKKKSVHPLNISLSIQDDGRTVKLFENLAPAIHATEENLSDKDKRKRSTTIVMPQKVNRFSTYVGNVSNNFHIWEDESIKLFVEVHNHGRVVKIFGGDYCGWSRDNILAKNNFITGVSENDMLLIDNYEKKKPVFLGFGGHNDNSLLNAVITTTRPLPSHDKKSEQ